MTEERFDSDSARHARPLRYVQTVTFDETFNLESGDRLSSVTVAFETYGQLNAAKDNAVLIAHAISGDSHVAMHNDDDDPGWWDIVVGSGKPIDTNRYFVICPNLLGGCRGTTGPGSVNPETGQPYGRDFPTITIGDMVEVERRLADHLGIDTLLAVVGGSMGGHQALTWATRLPGRVKGVIPIATSSRLTSQALAFDVVGRNAIRRDPHYHGGRYHTDQHGGPQVGLAIARMIAHITYLSREAMRQKFEADRLKPRDAAIEFEKTFSVGSYLGYQGQKFVERFDANSYMVLSMAMDLFDLGSTPAELAAALGRAPCRWLFISYSSDWLFPPDQSRDMVNALVSLDAPVSYCNVQSNCGHDAFLLSDDLDRYGELMRAFLANLTGVGVVPSDEREDTAGHSDTSIFHARRIDYDRIVELIPEGASVLDLGCGRGGVLARLRQKGHRRLLGIEYDEQAVVACVQRDVDVIHADLNKGLSPFADRQFDYVLLSQTLQAVKDVERVIDDMLRVGRMCIVSFPNMAFKTLRRMLAEEGRAPRSAGLLHYEWHNSPNIRFLSILDFEDFCRAKSIRIHRRITLDTEAGTEVFEDPNRSADLAIFVISR